MYIHVHACTCMYNIYTEQTTPTLGVVAASPSNQQLLDQLPVERERGITVKAQTATMFYNKIGTDKQTHMLNLIDTPVRLYVTSPSPHLLFPSSLFSLSPSLTTTFSLSIILIPVSFPYSSHSLSLIVIYSSRLHLFFLVTMVTQYLPHISSPFSLGSC